MSSINPVPQDKIGENFAWREWATKVTLYTQSLQKGDQTGSLFNPPQYPTASAPKYAKGSVYFDTTLNKLRVGGASAWETITSA